MYWRHLNVLGVSRGLGLPLRSGCATARTCGAGGDVQMATPSGGAAGHTVRVSLVDMPEHVYVAFIKEVRRPRRRLPSSVGLSALRAQGSHGQDARRGAAPRQPERRPRAGPQVRAALF